MKKSLLILAALALGASISNAVTLKVTSGTNDTLAFSDGSTGAMTILVGYYSVLPDFTSVAASVAFSTFTTAATFNYDGATGAIAGSLGTNSTTELTIDPWTGSPGSGPAFGKVIYAWVFDSGFTGTFASAGQYGLFNQTATFQQSDGAVPANSVIQFTDITTNYTQVRYGSVVDAAPGTAGAAQFQLVPEPSTAVLGLMAGLGLVTRRRRA